MDYFLGVDVGSCTTKGVLIDEDKHIASRRVIRTKPIHQEGLEIIRRLIRSDLGGMGRSEGCDREFLYCVGTGYGRDNVGFAQTARTEIACHARGAHHLYPPARTVIDIGGQDAKIIRVDERGDVRDFVLNEKCAAGTGRFLELASRILKVPIQRFGEIVVQTNENCTISSTCAVFAQSEMISKLSEGVRYESILKGIHSSIVSRLIGMGRRIGITPPVVVTGGVAENRGIIHEIISQLRLEAHDLFVPAEPTVVGALGAALFARDFCVGAGS